MKNVQTSVEEKSDIESKIDRLLEQGSPVLMTKYNEILAKAKALAARDMSFVVHYDQVYMAAFAASVNYNKFVSIVPPGEGKIFALLLLLQHILEKEGNEKKLAVIYSPSEFVAEQIE